MVMDIEKAKKFIKNIRVIYTDVDGTLVTDGCLFRNSTGYSFNNAEAIFKLHTLDVDVVMTSGREKDNLTGTARILGFQNYIANLGIEIVYNQGEKVLTNFGVDVADKKALKRWIENSGIVSSLFDKFPAQVTHYTPWSNMLSTHHLLIGELDYPVVKRWVELTFPKIRIIDNGLVEPSHGFNRPHTYHIVPKNVGKRLAVQTDKKERILQTENLIGIGDSMEDVMMAEEVGLFFLLDPAVESTRENVVYTDNQDGNGFSRIINFLIDAEFI